MLGSLGSGAEGAVSGGRGVKVSPGDFYTVRGCMNQISPENCQIRGNSEQNSVGWTQRLGKAGAGGTTGKLPPSSGSYIWEVSCFIWGLWGEQDAVGTHFCLAMLMAGVPRRASPGTCNCGQSCCLFEWDVLLSLWRWIVGSCLSAECSLLHVRNLLLQPPNCRNVALLDPDLLPCVHQEGLGAQWELR